MKIKKLNESMLPSQATLDDCLDDYRQNAFGFSGVEDYVDTNYPMHPQEFKAAICDYLKNHKNESLQEAWQVGDQVTIKWNEPNFEPYAYATCEYQGKTEDGKHKFKSTTYGWDFIVDLENKKIKTPHDKEYDLWDESGWTKNVVEEDIKTSESKSIKEDIECNNKLVIEVKSGISADGFNCTIYDSTGEVVYKHEYMYGYNASYNKAWADEKAPYVTDIINDLCVKYSIDKNNIEIIAGRNIFKGANVSTDYIERFKQNYLNESKYISESANTMIYLFPELTDEDLEMAKGYGLKYLGKNHGADGSEDNWVLRGAESSLRMFADKYLGYELHPDYLYDEEDFAGDIINESLVGLELDKDDILDWLAEHEQAWADAERHFGGSPMEFAMTSDADSPLEEVSVKDLVGWIADHKQLYDDFHRFFYEDNLDEEFLNFDFNQNPDDDIDGIIQ